MYKDEFVTRVMEKARNDLPVNSNGDVNRSAAGRIIDSVFDTITEALMNGESVTLMGFGTFETVNRGERTYTDIRTHERKTSPASVVPKFRPGAGLRAQVKGKT